MSSRNQYSATEVTAGIFLAFCAALFLGLVLTSGKVTRFWRPSREVRVLFDNISSLPLQAPVRYNGKEIGRVKAIEVVHIDQKMIDKMRPLTPQDLDDLPIRSDDVKLELMHLPAADFKDRVAAAVMNRSMIRLTLEMTSESEFNLYREDDRVQIVSNIMGDSALEISSGSGKLIFNDREYLFLGTSGDFFSNIGKSMGDVRGILSKVTGTIGRDDIRSFESAQLRGNKFGRKLEHIAATVALRTPETAEKYDKASEAARAAFGDSGKQTGISPDAQKALEGLGQSAGAIQNKLAELGSTVNKAREEITTETEAAIKEVRAAFEGIDPDIDIARKSLNEAKARLSGLGNRLSGASATVANVQRDCVPDIERGIAAVSQILSDLKDAGAGGLANIDLMLGNRDAGEYFTATLLESRRLTGVAAQRIRNARSEMDRTTSGVYISPGEQERIGREAEEAGRELDKVAQSLQECLGVLDTKIVPVFQRKRAGATVRK